ncbi:hypothetical protein [Chryseobacterium sp. PMSZPI]|nr:hypothetical protein [Chryseobacterium sp. PMSZPI]
MKRLKSLRESWKTSKGTPIQAEASYSHPNKITPPKEGVIDSCNQWCYF